MLRMLESFIAVLALFAVYCGCACAGDATVPGELTTPYPTIINLAVDWKIEGDDNLNGRVTVRFRKVGTRKWRGAMPLFRVPAGHSNGTRPIFNWVNKHSGSIFDLVPDTEYEIELTLTDPDGGNAKKTVRAKTRSVPRAPKGARKRKITPATIGSVKPGEIGILAPGNYGTFVAKQDGKPGQPVVYRSTDGKAVFEKISLNGRKHVYLEGVTVKARRDIKWPIAVHILGSEDCVVRRCNITALYGVRAGKAPGAKNCYIADNIVRAYTPWTNEAMGAGGKNKGEGIQITGPGNVICFNRASNYRDCISTMEDRSVINQTCIDIYNNDIFVGPDDGIEADFCFSNCRIMRNRITNCYVGLSSQPGLGGPNYFIRNVQYNTIHAAFKFKRGSVGDVVLHNTIIKVGTGMGGNSSMDHAYFRNNLCIGGPTGGKRWGGYGVGAPAGAGVVSPGSHSSFDYDAVGTFQAPFRATIGRQDFKSVEPHGIIIDIGVFKDVTFPLPPDKEYPPPDLRPRADSKVVDAGVRIPNVNDDFNGNAPDIGAYEAGQELPVYGPRPKGMDEKTEAKKKEAAK